MLQPEAKEAWYATLHELGFEPRNVRHTHVGPAPTGVLRILVQIEGERVVFCGFGDRHMG